MSPTGPCSSLAFSSCFGSFSLVVSRSFLILFALLAFWLVAAELTLSLLSGLIAFSSDAVGLVAAELTLSLLSGLIARSLCSRG